MSSLADDAARRDRARRAKAARARRWREEHLEQERERRRQWGRDNIEYVTAYNAQYNAANREQLNQKRMEYYFRTVAAERRDAARRRSAGERAKRWAERYPEKAAAAKLRYRQAYPEKVREAGRNYYHRNKDEIRERRFAREDPVKVAEARRRYQQNYVRNSPSDWKASEEQLEAYRRANRDRRRLVRRLAAAGLPPRRLHVVSAAQARANEREAGAFFSRRRAPSERLDVAREREPFATPAAYLRDLSIELATIRTRPQVAEAGRRYLARHGSRIRTEVRMDSIARQMRGLGPLDEEREVLARVSEALRIAKPGLSVGRRPFLFVPSPTRRQGSVDADAPDCSLER